MKPAVSNGGPRKDKDFEARSIDRHIDGGTGWLRSTRTLFHDVPFSGPLQLLQQQELRSTMHGPRARRRSRSVAARCASPPISIRHRSINLLGAPAPTTDISSRYMLR